MSEFIGNVLVVLVGLEGEPDALIGRVAWFLLHRPLPIRHVCDMPVVWSHLSSANWHLVRLSSTTSFWICLFRSFSVSSAEFSQRFRSRSSERD